MSLTKEEYMKIVTNPILLSKDMERLMNENCIVEKDDRIFIQYNLSDGQEN